MYYNQLHLPFVNTPYLLYLAILAICEHPQWLMFYMNILCVLIMIKKLPTPALVVQAIFIQHCFCWPLTRFLPKNSQAGQKGSSTFSSPCFFKRAEQEQIKDYGEGQLSQRKEIPFYIAKNRRYFFLLKKQTCLHKICICIVIKLVWFIVQYISMHWEWLQLNDLCSYCWVHLCIYLWWSAWKSVCFLMEKPWTGLGLDVCI